LSATNRRQEYFKSVEDCRIKDTEDQIDRWAWQKRQYAKGDDPINKWRERRASDQISNLENQYGDPKKGGGIPLLTASFGGELVAHPLLCPTPPPTLLGSIVSFAPP
jgi:hypothetical protein